MALPPNRNSSWLLHLFDEKEKEEKESRKNMLNRCNSPPPRSFLYLPTCCELRLFFNSYHGRNNPSVKGLCIGRSRKGNNATGYSNGKAEGNIIKQLFEEYETKKLCESETNQPPQQKAADSFCIKLLLGSAGLFLGWLCWFKT